MDFEKLKKYARPQTLIRWTPEGIPVPYTEWKIHKTAMEDLMLTALSLPYSGTKDLVTGDQVIEPEYEGMSNVEVAFIRAANMAANGNLESLKFIVERLFGKPKQQVESTNVNITLADLLQDLAPSIKEKEEDWMQKMKNANTIIDIHTDIEADPNDE